MFNQSAAQLELSNSRTLEPDFVLQGSVVLDHGAVQAVALSRVWVCSREGDRPNGLGLGFGALTTPMMTRANWRRETRSLHAFGKISPVRFLSGLAESRDSLIRGIRHRREGIQDQAGRGLIGWILSECRNKTLWCASEMLTSTLRSRSGSCMPWSTIRTRRLLG